MKDELIARSGEVGRYAAACYAALLAYGAHPNEKAFSTRMRIEESESSRRFSLKYLDRPGPALA
jgi:hypothetical protein